MLNVWTRPYEICKFLKEMYPSSQIEGIVQQGSFSLRWSVQSIQSDIYIRNGVDSVAFEEQITAFIEKAEVSVLASKVPILDTSRFALCCALQNWGKFQRVALNISDASCVELVIRLLEEEATVTQSLEEIGLAPSQLAKNPIDQNDLEIFRELVKKLKNMQKARADAVFQKLENTYPVVFEKIWVEIKQESKQASSRDGYTQILDRLNQTVVGQRFATELVANTIAGQENNIGRNQFFLFVGPPGVGKTELAKATAGLKGNRFTMLCMNRYTDKTSSNKLFGSSPGYVGSTSLPHFVQEIEKFTPAKKEEENNRTTYEVRNVVILFDEMEKAHPEVKQSLLDLFMEGRCEAQYTEDSTNVTKEYIFLDSIFVATSNLYQEQILACYEDDISHQLIASNFRKWNEEFQTPQSFSPEFLSRGTIVPFGPISRGKDSYQRIIQIKLDAKFAVLEKELPCNSVQLEGREEVLQILENLLYGNGTDIRKIDRFFHNSITLNIRTLATENSVPLKDMAIIIFPLSSLGIGVQFTKMVFGKAMHFLEENRRLYNPLEVGNL